LASFSHGADAQWACVKEPLPSGLPKKNTTKAFPCQAFCRKKASFFPRFFPGKTHSKKTGYSVVFPHFSLTYSRPICYPNGNHLKEAFNMAKTVQDILNLIREKDIKMVDFKMVDINGQYRHVTIPAENFSEDTM